MLNASCNWGRDNRFGAGQGRDEQEAPRQRRTGSNQTWDIGLPL